MHTYESGRVTGLRLTPWLRAPLKAPLAEQERAYLSVRAFMARAQDPNSADSQFFICFDDASFLDGQYTVWGKVVNGMEHVDQLKRGEPPANPDRIVKMQVAADA